MIDNMLSSKEKRFMFFSFVLGLILYVSFYRFFLFSQHLISLSSTADLMSLTSPSVVKLYWPISVVAHVMDTQLSLSMVVVGLTRSVPLQMIISVMLIVYLGSNIFNKEHPFYRYQQIILIYTLLLIVCHFVFLLLFLYGFLGGSIATALARVVLSGQFAMVMSVVFLLVHLLYMLRLFMQYDTFYKKDFNE